MLHAPCAMRVMVVAAHPGDETIGASALLAASSDAIVIHATDGAPEDARWWPAGITDRREYSFLREHEAERALAHVCATRIALGVIDQHAVHEIDRIAALVAERLVAREPDVIVTHAYEGGHPDNDAVAVAVARARALARSSAPLCEMALYNGAHGELVVGEFIDGGGTSWLLGDTQRARRDAMIECFTSQRDAIAPFRALDRERYRPAPAYDFSSPPHDGPLWYERLGFSISGAGWRAIVAARMRHADCTADSQP
jgi:N-acetylglucosamine malate deacetylase 2